MIRLCKARPKEINPIMPRTQLEHTFNTSAGEHTVVATVPYKPVESHIECVFAKLTAAKLAVKWHRMLSSKYFVFKSSALKKS